MNPLIDLDGAGFAEPLTTRFPKRKPGIIVLINILQYIYDLHVFPVAGRQLIGFIPRSLI